MMASLYQSGSGVIMVFLSLSSGQQRNREPAQQRRQGSLAARHPLAGEFIKPGALGEGKSGPLPAGAELDRKPGCDRDALAAVLAAREGDHMVALRALGNEWSIR